ncbi:hypothetical protein CPter291_2065 [Collimonas pratensis]|uniref:Uncharacterized protein n=1 Tax=Collimonas pratensis TaxID=279113 RepID=A0ABM5Z5L3_9BURK|nr:hypothetical protein CPter291_2065 [Collimonas pratensis]
MNACQSAIFFLNQNFFCGFNPVSETASFHIASRRIGINGE